MTADKKVGFLEAFTDMCNDSKARYRNATDRGAEAMPYSVRDNALMKYLYLDSGGLWNYVTTDIKDMMLWSFIKIDDFDEGNICVEKYFDDLEISNIFNFKDRGHKDDTELIKLNNDMAWSPFLGAVVEVVKNWEVVNVNKGIR